MSRTERRSRPSWPALLPLLLLAAAPCAYGQSRYAYREAPVRQVISDVQQGTGYWFLYREALVAGKRVSFEAHAAEVLPAFDRALGTLGLALRIDTSRKQVFISERPSPNAPEEVVTLTGQVLDDETGARLPRAAIAWMQEGRLRGVSANEAGAFSLSVDARGRDTLDLAISYVGYRTEHVRVDVRRLPHELSVRLLPQAAYGPEAVVTGSMLDTEVDTSWQHLLQPGFSSPLGEGSLFRALQTLPSVAFAPAFVQGLSVRGSRSDGFQVLLDGISIYNQSHFFGLFDAFNQGALQTAGLYYGVAPAYLEAPPGGTLSFATRTGAQTGVRRSVSLTSATAKATLEGPLFGGRASWLASGRHSYLDGPAWPANGTLVARGLGIERPREASTIPPAPGHALFPGAPETASARFFDLHGKLYQESPDGSRRTLNLYLGGDRTGYEARRLVHRDDPAEPVGHALLEPAASRNRWGNSAATLHDQRSLGRWGYAYTLAGLSRYYSAFSKDDFVYTLPPSMEGHAPGVHPRRFVESFANENSLLEWKLSQRIDGASRRGNSWSAGYALHRFALFYAEERSGALPSYADRRRSTQLDIFTQYDLKQPEAADLHLGLRSHYFSQGRFLGLSPRVQLRLRPDRRLSLGAGYSRNYQFLHRLYLAHTRSADVWVMSTREERPGSVDHVTAGLYLKALPSFFVQVEVYEKRYENVRQHAFSILPLPPGEGSLLASPWLSDNTMRARGLELMTRHAPGTVVWTNSYTLSRVKVRSDRLNAGRYFPAEWDRRHQLISHLEGALGSRLYWRLTWLFASGAPNLLAYTDPGESARLKPYHRMDVSLAYRRAFRAVVLEARASVFNLYARNNTAYRTPVSFADMSGAAHEAGFVNVDVYDLGFQPSFELSLAF